jgi:hypothetical protein
VNRWLVFSNDMMMKGAMADGHGYLPLGSKPSA